MDAVNRVFPSLSTGCEACPLEYPYRTRHCIRHQGIIGRGGGPAQAKQHSRWNANARIYIYFFTVTFWFEHEKIINISSNRRMKQLTDWLSNPH